MNSVSQKVTCRSGLSKAILVIRKKVVCFKEGKQLLGDDSLHSLRDERGDCNWAIVRRIRLVPFFRDRENVGKFPGRRKYTNRVGKLKEFVENRWEFGGTGFKYYSWGYHQGLWI